MVLDVRLVNANIITMDPNYPCAHELGVWRGRIVALDGAAASLPARRVVDLQAATVLPGFIDAHVHLAWTGLRARSVTGVCRGGAGGYRPSQPARTARLLACYLASQP